MKKLMYFLAAASLMLVACDKAEKTNYTSQMDAPAGQPVHGTMSISKSDAPTVTNPVTAESDKMLGVVIPSSSAEPDKGYGDGGGGSTGIVLMENGGAVGMTFTASQNVSKAISENMGYYIHGIGGLAVKSRDGKKVNLSLTAPDGKVTDFSATVADEPKQTPVMKDACRIWTVEETTFTVQEGTGTPITGTYQGCDLGSITADIADHGINIKPLGQLYYVQNVIFTEAGNFGIVLGAKSFYGSCKFSGTKFTYDFDFYDDCPVIAEEASGDFSVVNNFGRLELNSKLKDQNGKSYDANIILKMSPEVPYSFR